MKRIGFCLFFLLVSCSDGTRTNIHIHTFNNSEITDFAPVPLISGTEFLTEETRALQNDSFANPALLWVDRGESLFSKTMASGKACADCHSDNTALPLTKSATTFPKHNPRTGTLINLEGQINMCRIHHQNEAALSYESQDLLALTTYTAQLAKGQTISMDVTAKNRKNFLNGKDYFFTRRGQMNFSCAQCHDDNWGKKLRGDTISQGHGNGFPAYRLEWESLGSLHRRFADCDRGVRAEPLELGAQTYIDLELYLAARARGLTIETPAIRR